MTKSRKRAPSRKHNNRGANRNPRRQSSMIEMDDIDEIVKHIESNQTDSKDGVFTSDRTMALEVYRPIIDQSLRNRLDTLASRISAIINKEPAFYGRTVSAELRNVPSLWKASLGGSRILLLAEVVGLSSRKHHVARIQDFHGHQAMVRFRPDTEFGIHCFQPIYPFNSKIQRVKIPLFKCLLPGVFILIKGAYWQESVKGGLEMYVEKPEAVDFFPHLEMIFRARRPHIVPQVQMAQPQ